MQSNSIVIFSKREFLHQLLKQTYPERQIHHYQNFNISEIINHEIVIFDDISLEDSLLRDINQICTLIILKDSKKETQAFAKQLNKPIKYSSLCDIINKTQINRIQISQHILVNINSKTLIKSFNGKIICTPITETELNLIKCMVEDNENSKDQLLCKVLGYSPSAETHTIDTHLSRLRKKLEPECSIRISADGKYKFLLKNMEQNPYV